MAKWYTYDFMHRIKTVIVVRETAHFIVISAHGREYKEKKTSRSGKYFTTYEETREHLAQNLAQHLRSCERMVELAVEEISEFEQSCPKTEPDAEPAPRGALRAY